MKRNPRFEHILTNRLWRLIHRLSLEWELYRFCIKRYNKKYNNNKRGVCCYMIKRDGIAGGRVGYRVVDEMTSSFFRLNGNCKRRDETVRLGIQSREFTGNAVVGLRLIMVMLENSKVYIM